MDQNTIIGLVLGGLLFYFFREKFIKSRREQLDHEIKEQRQKSDIAAHDATVSADDFLKRVHQYYESGDKKTSDSKNE